MRKYGFDDASMTRGKRFLIMRRRRGGLFGLCDKTPPASASTPLAMRQRRKRWPLDQVGTQIGWAEHGRVQLLRLEDGSEIAAWWEETREVPQKRG